MSTTIEFRQLRENLFPKLKGIEKDRRIFRFALLAGRHLCDNVGDRIVGGAGPANVYYVYDDFPGGRDQWVMVAWPNGCASIRRLDADRYIPRCTSTMDQLDIGAQEAYDAGTGGKMLMNAGTAGGSDLDRRRADVARAKLELAAAEAALREEEERERRGFRARLAADATGLMDELLRPLGLEQHPRRVAIYQLARRWSLDHDEDVRDVLKQLREVFPPAPEGGYAVTHYAALRDFHAATVRFLTPTHHALVPCTIMSSNHKNKECVGCAHHEVLRTQPKLPLPRT